VRIVGLGKFWLYWAGQGAVIATDVIARLSARYSRGDLAMRRGREMARRVRLDPAGGDRAVRTGR